MHKTKQQLSIGIIYLDVEEKQKADEKRWVAFAASFSMVLISLFLHVPQFFGFSFEYVNITHESNGTIDTFECWVANPTW